MLGCDIPFDNPTGPRTVPNKAVDWETIGAFRFEGGLWSDLRYPDYFRVTDANGKAYATFTASEQVVPPYLRVIKSFSPGWIWVKATSLLTQWTGMEAGVDLMNSPTGAPTQINVGHYGPSVGIRYSGGARIALVNGGDGTEVLYFPDTPGVEPLSAHPDVAAWRVGGKGVLGTKRFTMHQSSAKGSASAEFTLDAPSAGIGSEFRVQAATTGNNYGNATIDVRSTALFDILNPAPQKDLEVTWDFPADTERSSGHLMMTVEKGSTGEAVPVSGPTGTVRMELSHHEYVVFELRQVRSESRGSASTGSSESYTGEVNVRMVE